MPDTIYSTLLYKAENTKEDKCQKSTARNTTLNHRKQWYRKKILKKAQKENILPTEEQKSELHPTSPPRRRQQREMSKVLREKQWRNKTFHNEY